MFLKAKTVKIDFSVFVSSGEDEMDATTTTKADQQQLLSAKKKTLTEKKEATTKKTKLKRIKKSNHKILEIFKLNFYFLLFHSLDQPKV